MISARKLFLPALVTLLTAYGANAQTVKIMPLGDSITQGTGSSQSPPGGYRDDLAASLTAAGVNFDFVGSLQDGTGFDPDHEGHPAMTALEMKSQVSAWVQAAAPDVVILQIGTNDVNELNQQGATAITDTVVARINSIVTRILDYNPQMTVLLVSLLPRTDALDSKAEEISRAIQNLASSKREAGYRLYFVGLYYMMKAQPNWNTALMADAFHPNDAGYALMAEGIFHVLRRALGLREDVVDDFSRSTLGSMWAHGGGFTIQNGALSNQTPGNNWNVAIYVGHANPKVVRIVWDETATSTGIHEGGIALMLNSENAAQADGYLVWHNGSYVSLWTIKDGQPDEPIMDVPARLSMPVAGDTFRVVITSDATQHRFECYKNSQLDAVVYDNNKLYGNTPYWFAGVGLRAGLPNNVETFDLTTEADLVAPAAITDLKVEGVTTNSVYLSWTAPGDDGSDQGQAASYDIRYSTQPIDYYNFNAAIRVPNPPPPSAPGTKESLHIFGLEPNTTYFFAIRTADDVGNLSALSNVASGKTAAGLVITDEFNRSQLGPDWVAGSEWQIVNGALHNGATDGGWDHIAIYGAKKNPGEVSIKWSSSANLSGINEGGIGLFSAASLTANGYLIWISTQGNVMNKVHLWTIVNGLVTTGEELILIPSQAPLPGPGSVFKVIPRFGTNNAVYFDVFVDGTPAATLADMSGSPRITSSNYYAGVVLRAGLNNDVDAFSITTQLGSPTNLTVVQGQNQTGTVGQWLPDSILVKVTDENGNPLSGIPIRAEILQGGGQLDPEISTGPHLRVDIGGPGFDESSTIHWEADKPYPQGTWTYGKWGYVGGSPGSTSSPISGTERDQLYQTERWGISEFKVDVPNGLYTVRLHFVEMAHTSSGSRVFDVKIENQTVLSNLDIFAEVGRNAALVKTFQVQVNDGVLNVAFVKKIEDPEIAGIEVFQGSEGLITDTRGITGVRWRLGTSAGTQSLRFSAEGYSLTPVTVTATALPAAAQQLSYVSGNNQSGAAGTQLPNPLVVKVTDQYGNAVPNHPVLFEATQGGGRFVSTGTGQATVATNSSGLASVSFILGSQADTNIVRASSSGLQGSPITFKLVATSGVPKSLVYVSGNGQTGTVGRRLADSLKVRVLDRINQGVGGIQVRFDVLQGGGSVSSSVVATNAQGYAAVSWVLGTAIGLQKVQASVSGLQGSPIVFSAMASADLPYRVVKASRDSLRGAAGKLLDDTIRVRVTDQYGNPIAGHSVTFYIVSGGGNLGGAADTTVATDATGIASVRWTLGPTPGATNQLGYRSFASGGAHLQGSPGQFFAFAGDVSRLDYVRGSGQVVSIRRQAPIPLEVQLMDEFGYSVVSYPVTFRVKAGAATFGGGASDTVRVVQTNQQGLASVTAVMGAVYGQSVRIVAEAKDSKGQLVQNAPMVFSLRTPGIRSVEYVSGDGQVGRAGELLENPFVVLVRDSLNNPAPDYEVTYRVVEGGGRFDGDTTRVVRTDDSGRARATLRVGTTVGQQNVALAHVRWAGLDVLNSPVRFTATTAPGLPDSLVYVDGDRQEGLIGTALPKALKVRVKDRYGNGVPNHTVTFTVTAGGGSLDQAGQSTVTKTTNSQGICEVRWILGNQAGQLNNVVEARSLYDNVEIHGSPIVFRATAYSTTADSVAYVSGDGTSGVVGEILATPLRVRVFDRHRNPVLNHPVTFEVVQGDGLVLSSSDTGRTVVVASDREGYATVSFRLGTRAGSANNVVRATSTDGVNPLRGSPVLFRVSGIAALPLADSCHVTASPETLRADGVSKATLTVHLRDRYGNPVPNKAVIFDVAGEDARVEQPTALTDANGQASGRLSSTKSGWKWVTARDISDQVTITRGARVLFRPLEAYRIAYHSGNNQTRNVGTVLAERLAVRVTDRFDNPIAGHPVQFVVTERGGRIVEPQPVYTDSQGIAAATMILGKEPGDNFAEARASGLQGSPVLFREVGVVNRPTTIDVVSGDGQRGVAGEFLKDPLVVRVLDAHGDPVWGALVQFLAPSGGVAWPSVDSTDAYGLASCYFKPGNLVGVYPVVATIADVADNAVFSATAVAGNAARVQAVSGQGQTGTVGSKLANRLVVQVIDRYGNGVQGVPVQFEVVRGGGSLSPSGSVSSNAQGLCSVEWTLGTRSGYQEVRVSGENLEGVPLYFWANALPASPDSMMAYSGDKQHGQAGQPLPLPIAVKVVDRYGNPVPNVNITFTPVDGMSSVERGNAVTDSAGIAQTRWILGSQPGQNIAWAIKLGVKGSPVVFTAVGESNKFPVISCPSDTTVMEGQELRFLVSATDPDGGAVQLGVRGLPRGAVFDSTTTGEFSWTPDYQQAGIYEVLFVARDNEGGVQYRPLRIHVLNFNRRPQLTSWTPADSVLARTYGDTLLFSVEATDPDGDSLRFAWYTVNASAKRFVSATSLYRFVPERYDPGLVQVLAFVTDGTDTVSVRWRVTVLTSVELEAFAGEVAPFHGVVIRWRTTRESGLVGFNIYRATSENGEYVRLNSRPIPPDPSRQYAFVDAKVDAGRTYYYRLEDVSVSGKALMHDPIAVTVLLPRTFQVYQNFPNPFNPVTTIRFELPKDQRVRVEVFNVLGQRVRLLLDEHVEAGFHEVRWDGRDELGRDVASGVYYVRVHAGEASQVKKMLLLR
ncbi:MAG: Ig-like domain-containing protein [candidate division KSB1 bacterium]|nr:Ig-like domain-containing protein [candidate division KSB1 bacterium]